MLCWTRNLIVIDILVAASGCLLRVVLATLGVGGAGVAVAGTQVLDGLDADVVFASEGNHATGGDEGLDLHNESLRPRLAVRLDVCPKVVVGVRTKDDSIIIDLLLAQQRDYSWDSLSARLLAMQWGEWLAQHLGWY